MGALVKFWRGFVRGGAWALSIYALILIVRVFA